MAFSSWRTWVTGEVVTAAHMNQEVRDNGAALFPNEDGAVSWTPGLAATVGNPAVTTVGRRYRIGALQFVWARFVITSSGGGDGFFYVTLPVAASGVSAFAAEGSGQAIGSWSARDNTAVNSIGGSVLLRASDEAWFNIGPTLLSDTNPWTFAPDDVISFHAVYPVA